MRGILEKIESSRQDELEQIEKRYRDIILEKDKQHREFLEEIDQLMLEQENEVSDIKQKNDGLQIQVHNYQQERDYVKNFLEAENNKLKEKLEFVEIENNQLTITLNQLVRVHNSLY